MSTMSYSEVLDNVNRFNSFVMEKPWLDVDLFECSPQVMLLHCGIDLTVGPEIEIRFESIVLVSLLASWKTDTSHPVLQILEGEAAREVNMQYRVEQGNNLFTFQPEDYADGVRCMIAARSFSWRELTPDKNQHHVNPGG